MLLSSLKFGSFLSYSSHGDSLEAQASRKLRDQVKQDIVIQDRDGNRMLMSEYVAKRLRAALPSTGLAELFCGDLALVPAPGSSLTMRAGLRVPLRIAKALVGVRLGTAVIDLLERTSPVRKSAFCNPWERPKASEHYETIVAKQLAIGSFDRMIVIDDFVTRGATTLAAASRLAEAYPSAEISAFAMVRTISQPSEFMQIDDPCVGEIVLIGEDTFRRP